MKNFWPLQRIDIRVSQIIFFIVILFSTSAYGQELDKNGLIAKFEQLDNNLNQGDGYSKYSNDNGTLSWAQSYLLEAYLEMYSVTKNPKWIEKFIVQGNRVIANTDKIKGLRDYKGRSLFGWSSVRYSKPYGAMHHNEIDLSEKNKPRVVIWSHSGMIACPFVKFGLLVRKDKRLKAYNHEAGKFISAAEEAMAVFDKKWVYNKKTEEGFFIFNDEPVYGNYRGLEVTSKNIDYRESINSDLAVGRVYIGLYQLNKKSDYLNKVRGLANKFKKQLILYQNKYIWYYRYLEDLKYNNNWEDLAHGSIDVSFAYDAYKANIVFNHNDMLRFANTLLGTYKNNAFTKYIDGKSHEVDIEMSMSSGIWLDLSSFNVQVYKIIYKYITQKIDLKNQVHPKVMLGVAKLAKYYDEVLKN